MSPEIKDENIRDRNGTVVAGGSLFRKYLLNRECELDDLAKGTTVGLVLGLGDNREDLTRDTVEVLWLGPYVRQVL
jgi:hypothetical protein